MTVSRLFLEPAPGRERATALRSFPDWPALPLSGFGIGALSPRRMGTVGASLTLTGKLSGMTLACRFPVLLVRGALAQANRFPVFSRQVESLDGLPKGGAGLVVGEALAHIGLHRIGDAACHGAGRAGGAP